MFHQECPQRSPPFPCATTSSPYARPLNCSHPTSAPALHRGDRHHCTAAPAAQSSAYATPVEIHVTFLPCLQTKRKHQSQYTQASILSLRKPCWRSLNQAPCLSAALSPLVALNFLCKQAHLHPGHCPRAALFPAAAHQPASALYPGIPTPAQTNTHTVHLPTAGKPPNPLLTAAAPCALATVSWRTPAPPLTCCETHGLPGNRRRRRQRMRFGARVGNSQLPYL
ncbi:MAG: hypothetical protein J3K34DRAFT_430176 [Monoraphidium minutum]|nr:MAG: hypothetical protein J3K34DRAFT_430176 [Monoraphidium minutum]